MGGELCALGGKNPLALQQNTSTHIQYATSAIPSHLLCCVPLHSPSGIGWMSGAGLSHHHYRAPVALAL